MSRQLPRCPCGSKPGQVTWSRGQVVPGGPTEPGRMKFDPCGHVIAAPSAEYVAAVRAMTAETQDGAQ